MSGLYAGLMSGTSLDGVDAVLSHPGRSSPLIAAHHVPMPSSLRDELQTLNRPGHDEIARAALAANQLTDLYAEAVLQVLTKAGVTAGSVSAIGCHGQTIRHQPSSGYTVQIVNGARLAELTGIAVVCDFRSRDVAAGGEGAPLVPAFHRAMFHAPGQHRVIANIGGMANISSLSADGTVLGFDSGPGNVLMDAWVERHLGHAYDESGRFAASGTIIPSLLAQISSHEYFRRLPPKSTGRESFDIPWLDSHLDGRERPEDVQATLLEFTAWSLAGAITLAGPGATGVYVCGGGAANSTLMARIAALLPAHVVTSTETLGVSPMWMEALAFAWLAMCRVERIPGNIPEVTGARGPRVLGAIYAP